VNRRSLRRLVVGATSAIGFVLLSAAPALANLDDGEVKGKSLGTGLVIVIFVLIPLGAGAVICFLAALPSMLRRPRYRPGRPWKHDPLWFNGPSDPNAAVVSARPGASARGGASAEW
jgi:hypothetical protein